MLRVRFEMPFCLPVTTSNPEWTLMMSEDLFLFEEWLTAELATAKTSSHEMDYNVRKSATFRADNLIAARAMLREYLKVKGAVIDSSSNPTLG